jgi:hypothetical protein
MWKTFLIKNRKIGNRRLSVTLLTPAPSYSFFLLNQDSQNQRYEDDQIIVYKNRISHLTPVIWNSKTTWLCYTYHI